ncbi:hypothetical protein [Flammeovirga pacifica]|nr:hypothetical protein [Flammeovirga pacifica]
MKKKKHTTSSKYTSLFEVAQVNSQKVEKEEFQKIYQSILQQIAFSS